MVESIFLEVTCGLRRKINRGHIAGGGGCLGPATSYSLLHPTMVWRSRFVFLLLGELRLHFIFTLSAIIFLLPSKVSSE